MQTCVFSDDVQEQMLGCWDSLLLGPSHSSEKEWFHMDYNNPKPKHSPTVPSGLQASRLPPFIKVRQ